MNPWWDAPIHLYSLFDPRASTAWYGETQNPLVAGTTATCMGVGGDAGPDLPTFTAASYPGDGAIGVIPDYSASELRYTPAAYLGISRGRHPTGQNILLYPGGDRSYRYSSATLTRPDGQVPVKVATPDTPAATKIPAGWESWSTLQYGYYAVPVDPLKPHSTYALVVNWLVGDPQRMVAQTVHFSTGPELKSGSCPADVCCPGG